MIRKLTVWYALPQVQTIPPGDYEVGRTPEAPELRGKGQVQAIVYLPQSGSYAVEFLDATFTIPAHNVANVVEAPPGK